MLHFGCQLQSRPVTPKNGGRFCTAEEVHVLRLMMISACPIIFHQQWTCLQLWRQNNYEHGFCRTARGNAFYLRRWLWYCSWSVPVELADILKIAFSDGFRLSQFWDMPFGFSPVPTTFHRMINVDPSPALGKHTLAYLDNMCTCDFTSHLGQLGETPRLLDCAGFK